MKLCDGDEENSLLSMTPSQDGIPPPDPIRVDWPKVNNTVDKKILKHVFSISLVGNKKSRCGLCWSFSGPSLDQPSGQFVFACGEWSVALRSALRI